ncbi:unnamed protein product [Schistocephalus solidus]|uniref:DDE Tnp4 domain-containing protein n=1 Tax=Schistocephalus solidus TaxID=70667 RepID=A0A183T5T1_SCHSO|nr:unnamed protein product [Schistocephalus solidus]
MPNLLDRRKTGYFVDFFNARVHRRKKEPICGVLLFGNGYYDSVQRLILHVASTINVHLDVWSEYFTLRQADNFHRVVEKGEYYAGSLPGKIPPIYGPTYNYWILSCYSTPLVDIKGHCAWG